jgi:hypothetical protein
MSETVTGSLEVRDASAAEPSADPTLEVPAGWRARFGLAEDESLRVVLADADEILLARHRPGAAQGGRGVPALRADLAVLPLADVLGAIHAAGRSGILSFRYLDQRKSVYLHRGEVVFAASSQRVDRLGECLLRAGVITLEQLREAERCYEPPGRFGKVLVERGFLTPRELWSGVKYQVEEIVRSLFSSPGGIVSFFEGDAQPDNVVRLSLETRRLVAEGIQRRDELRKFLTVLEDPRVRLASVEGFSGQLAGNERAIVDAIGGQRPFRDLCRALSFDRESAARSIQLLRLVGAVKLLRATPETPYLDERDLEAPDDEALRQRVARLTKLVSGLAAPLLRLEGEEALGGRLERVLDDATGRFPALLTGMAFGPGATLDPDLLAARALKLPGDREEQLVSALAEIVAYLEFEVKNHPAIEDPDALLAGVAGLRGALAEG